MDKKQIKKIVPATYEKVESANAKLLQEIEKLLDPKTGELKGFGKELKRAEERVLQKEEYTLERTRQILGKINQLREKENSLRKSMDDMERAYERQISRMEEILSKERHILDKGNQFLDKGNQIMNKENLIMQSQTRMEARAAEIKGSLEKVEHLYLYNNVHERQVIQSFHEMYDRPDYKEIFLRLVKGLDDETKAEIVRILQRQQFVRGHEGETQNVFSREEREKIVELKRELTQEVLKVSDDLYCYKHYFLPVNYFEPSVFVYKHGIDCIENPESIKEKDILDVGGFVGDSILVLKPLTEKRVVSFEAITENYEIMKKTVALNNLENVVLEHMALGADVGTVRMEYAGSSSAFHTNGVVKVRGTEEVCLETLDHYMEGKDLDIGLIKVDIEGAEQEFLKGAKKTIEKYRPVLLMSIYHNADDFFNIKPMIENWNLGYKFRIHKPTDYSVSREVLLICEVR